MSEFSPRPNDQGTYAQLWTIANPQGLAELPGSQAAEFFKKSNLDVNVLKQVWALSTPVGSINKPQFYAALRYIAMIQNGLSPISKDRLEACADFNIGPPKIAVFIAEDRPSNSLTSPGIGPGGASGVPSPLLPPSSISSSVSYTDVTRSSKTVMASAPTAAGDVEVKRIIWLDSPKDNRTSSFDITEEIDSISSSKRAELLLLQNRLAEEKAALALTVAKAEQDAHLSIAGVSIVFCSECY